MTGRRCSEDRCPTHLLMDSTTIKTNNKRKRSTKDFYGGIVRVDFLSYQSHCLLHWHFICEQSRSTILVIVNVRIMSCALMKLFSLITKVPMHARYYSLKQGLFGYINIDSSFIPNIFFNDRSNRRSNWL